MRLSLDRLDGRHGTGDGHGAPIEASVLVPVLERDGGSWVLFTERSPDMPTHAGEMSFPGGSREPADGTPRETALREAREEIGLDPAEAEGIGRLEDVRAPYGGVVRPYVARVPDREFDPDPREVSEIHRLPASALVDPSTYSSEPVDGTDGEPVTLPFFRVDGVVVWGLTGYLLGRLLERTAGWHPPADHDLSHPGALERSSSTG